MVAKKEELLDQRDYGVDEDRKAKKVGNYYLYYNTKGLEAIGFSGEENIRLWSWDIYDSINQMPPKNPFCYVINGLYTIAPLT